ncbi:4799_t:CDS:2, partial [Scutellospora calospora]
RTSCKKENKKSHKDNNNYDNSDHNDDNNHGMKSNKSNYEYSGILRRNRNIRFTLIVLLLGATILILVKSRYYSDPHALPELTGSSDTEVSSTDRLQITWRINLNEKIDSRSSFYKPEQFTEDALKRNKLIPVTAVVLGWKRINSLKIVVNYISKYPYIKEILIWNNNNETRLNVEVILLHI